MSIEEICVPFGNCGSSCAGSTFAERDVSLSMNNKREVWKSVPGVTGFYEASSHGRVRSVARLVYAPQCGGSKKIPSVVLKPATNKRGYRRVSLSVLGRSRNAFVHRLVAKAFLPREENRSDVNHKNGNPSDNHVDNIEWCTPKENSQHAIRVLGKMVGAQAPSAKLTDKDVLAIHATHVHGKKDHEIAERFGVSTTVISSILTGKTWCHLYPKGAKRIHPYATMTRLEMLKAGYLSACERKIIAHLRGLKRGLSADQIAYSINADSGNVAAKVSEMVRAGILVKTGMRKFPNGRRAVRLVTVAMEEDRG